MYTTKLLIVGGGPAAISICLQVVDEYQRQHLGGPLEIIVFEKGAKIGPGLPYSKSDDCYILNLPKDMMEPVYGKPGNFTKWLKSRPGAPQDTEFPPRHYFGEYLHFLSKKIQVEATKIGISIKYNTNCEVLNVEYNKGTVKVFTDQGDTVGDYLVFCTGHMSSSTYPNFIGKNGYFDNPWEEKLYEKLNPESEITIIGTRLTAIDIVLKLFTSGHRGKISMVSRSGMLPTVLSKDIPPYTLKHLTLANFDLMTQCGLRPLSLEDLAALSFAEINEAEGRSVLPNNIVRSYKEQSPECWLLDQIAQAELGPKPWQQVLFATYPIVPNIWAMLSLQDKKKFILHHKSTFLTYLASFPLENAYKLKEHIASRQLNILGGVTEIVESNKREFVIHFKDRDSLTSKILINGTGAGYIPTMDPFYKRMIDSGLLEEHEAGGIKVDHRTLQVISPGIGNHPKIFAVGEITWGACLATTDMSRVAIQSGRVALTLVRDCLKPLELAKIKSSLPEDRNKVVIHTSSYYGNFFNQSIGFFRRKPAILFGMSAIAVATTATVFSRNYSKK